LYLVRPELLADHDGEMIEDLSALSKLLLGLFGVQGAVGDPRGEVVPLLDRVSFERTVLKSQIRSLKKISTFCILLCFKKLF
jgi:hypothetical protein